MIFLSVGSQMPFDRLVAVVDEWAARHALCDEVFAQIGADARAPRCLEWVVSLSPADFDRRLAACSLFIAHAGMGSVISAWTLGKPMLLFPRRGALRETRNEHQLSTLRWLSDKPGIYAAFDEQQLSALLDRWHSDRTSMPGPDPLAVTPEQGRLVHQLSAFIGEA